VDHVVRGRLERERNAWLCTLRPNGTPHLTPVWFVFANDTWWISSGEWNRKIVHLAADPRVSLALEDGVSPVVAEGKAILHRDRGEFPPEIVAAFADKYDGWDITQPEKAGERVLVEVPVSRWLLAGTAQ
jgi:PPOX class probable F420-dependent enzyme